MSSVTYLPRFENVRDAGTDLGVLVEGEGGSNGPDRDEKKGIGSSKKL